jgi:tRNA(Ile)-lysidine synthase
VNRALAGRVRRFIGEEGLIQAEDRVLVAVSGGADSTCLLLVLASLRKSLGFELTAAHFDHGLRGKRAASSERRTVELLCRSLDVPLRVGAGKVSKFAKVAKRSTEDAARVLRYEFLAGVASELGCKAIATGHTKDDQAETVLLHLIRGSGLRGLAGMASAAPVPAQGARASDVRLIRPLLVLSRNETERCCREAGVTPVIDPSNRSLAFTRNRVRRELLPALRSFNPRIESALFDLANSAAADDAALDALARSLVEERKGGVAIAKPTLRAAPEALQSRAVRVAFAKVAGDSRELGRRHVEAVLRGARSPSGALDLPRDVVVEVQRSTVIFRQNEGAPRALPARGVSLTVPGAARFGGWCFEATVAPAPRDWRAGRDPLQAYLDLSVCNGRLTVRRRRNGDRFQPLGLSGEKKLQDFFVDAHVPRSERDATPLVCAGGRIAWVVGQRPADWAKVPSGARRTVRVRAERTGI